MENFDKVLEAMKKSESPLRAGDIATLAGMDKKEVEKAMKVLKEENKIVSPKRCYWQPR